MAELRAGPASLAGLEWLVRVGVAPMEAWACAMGWGDRVARSHASRLERAGWLERHRMIRGQGSLLAATRRGVRMSGLPVSAPAAPDPASWAHDSGCAWTAAWLGASGAREWRGPREVLTDPDLNRTVVWSTRSSLRRSGHRPDLMLRALPGLLAVEVELQRKSANRMVGIASMYRAWISEGEIAGVLYVCADARLADHVCTHAAQAGIPHGRGLWLELLDDIREQARGGTSRPVGAHAPAAAREG
jgi:hypothetical protein